MEEALETARPTDKMAIPRKDCLFIFDDLDEANRYWRTHDGTYLYEVTVNPANILHLGDMQLTDLIGSEFRGAISPPDQSRIAELSRQYWAGILSNNAILEMLVSSATVVTKLKGKSSLKDWVNSQVTKYDPNKDNSIEQILGIAEPDAKPSDGSQT